MVRAAEQDRPDARQKRTDWGQRKPGLDPAGLLFIDETAADTPMTRRYGRCPRGERLVCPVPHWHWKTTTFVAALRADGLVAPMVDGALNGDLFVADARLVLVPAVRPGDVVVMDNLASHKGVGAVRAIEAAGCSVAYLPPYSPDFNPIEQVFAKVKARLRAAELRTIDKVEGSFGTVHEAFPPTECGNYIRHAGYTATDLLQAHSSSRGCRWVNGPRRSVRRPRRASLSPQAHRGRSAGVHADAGQVDEFGGSTGDARLDESVLAARTGVGTATSARRIRAGGRRV